MKMSLNDYVLDHFHGYNLLFMLTCMLCICLYMVTVLNEVKLNSKYNA